MAISSLRSGKVLPDPYKDHPFHQGSNEEKETPIIVEQDSDSEDEEEQVTAEPNPEKYKPLVLKTLPSTLKYAFLDEEKAKPVIISSKLDMKQEKQLLEVLRKNKEAI